MLRYQEPNSKYEIFHFQVYGNMVEENEMYQQLQIICKEEVGRINIFRTNLVKFDKKAFATPNDCLLLHLCLRKLKKNNKNGTYLLCVCIGW